MSIADERYESRERKSIYRTLQRDPKHLHRISSLFSWKSAGLMSCCLHADFCLTYSCLYFLHMLTTQILNVFIGNRISLINVDLMQ